MKFFKEMDMENLEIIDNVFITLFGRSLYDKSIPIYSKIKQLL